MKSSRVCELGKTTCFEIIYSAVYTDGPFWIHFDRVSVNNVKLEE